MTVRNIDPRYLPAHVRHDNRGRFAEFIDTYGQSRLCPRSAIVLYNGAGHLRYALARKPGRRVMARLYAHTPVRYWSKGL